LVVYVGQARTSLSAFKNKIVAAKDSVLQSDLPDEVRRKQTLSGGETGTDYAEASSVKIRLCNIALPDPVLKYLSNSRAFFSEYTAI